MLARLLPAPRSPHSSLPFCCTWAGGLGATVNRHGRLMLSMVGTACFPTRLSHHCWGALAVSGRTVTTGLTMQSGSECVLGSGRGCTEQRGGRKGPACRVTEDTPPSARMATEPKVRTAPSHAAAQREAPAGTGNVRVNTRPPQRPNPASRPADSTQATESQGHPHLYTTDGESAGGHRDACPGEADRPSRKEGPGAFDNRLLVSSSDPCAPRLSLSSHRQICPLSLGSLPSRGHPRAGAASVPVMGWPQARTWGPYPSEKDGSHSRGAEYLFPGTP